MPLEEIKDLVEKQGKMIMAQGDTITELKKTVHNLYSEGDKLEAMQDGGKAVSEQVAMVEKIQDRLDEHEAALEDVQAKQNRPGNPGFQSPDAAQAEAWKKDFVGWARTGQGQNSLEAHEVQAQISVGAPSEGGIAVPEELDRKILTLLKDESPMRRVCGHRIVGGAKYSRPVKQGQSTSGWVGEEDSRPETGTPSFSEITPFMGEIYGNPKATQTSLDDIYFDVESFIVSDLTEEFAEKEGASFLVGNGVKKPKGIMNYSFVDTDDSTRPYGSFQYVATGVADNFAARSGDVSPADVLDELELEFKDGYLGNAHWMLNKRTLRVVRLWKDNDGNRLLQRSLSEGQPPALLGYPIVKNADMPSVGAGTIPILFGDFQRAYEIVDRIGVRMLRDPYTAKPFVQFYTTKRVGGFAIDTQAVKGIKCTA